MKITAIEALRYSPPEPARAHPAPSRPSWHGRQDVSHPLARYRGRRVDFNALMPWDDLWVRVRAENGTSGLGATQFAGPVAALVRDHLGPALVGEDCLATDRLADLMFRLTKPYGSAGIASCAVSAIDLALWDLRGRIAGEPVYRLLGGAPRRVPCYATTNDVDWAMELGFEAFKVTLSYGPEAGSEGLDRNEAFIAECRETIGDEPELCTSTAGCRSTWSTRCASPSASIPTSPAGSRSASCPKTSTGTSRYAAACPRRRSPPESTGTPTSPSSGRPRAAWSTCCSRTSSGAAGSPPSPGSRPSPTPPDSRRCPTSPAATAFGQHASVGIATIQRAEYRIGSDPGIPLDQTAQAPGALLPVNGHDRRERSPRLRHRHPRGASLPVLAGQRGLVRVRAASGHTIPARKRSRHGDLASMSIEDTAAFLSDLRLDAPLGRKSCPRR